MSDINTSLNTSEDNCRILEAELETLDLDEDTRRQLLNADDIVVNIIVQSKTQVICFRALQEVGLIKTLQDGAKYQFVTDYYRARMKRAKDTERAVNNRGDIQGILGGSN